MNARPPPSTESIASQIYPPHSESKPSAPSTTSGRMPPQSPSRSILGTNPQFGENPFDPRSVHPLYRQDLNIQTVKNVIDMQFVDLILDPLSHHKQFMDFLHMLVFRIHFLIYIQEVKIFELQVFKTMVIIVTS